MRLTIILLIIQILLIIRINTTNDNNTNNNTNNINAIFLLKLRLITNNFPPTNGRILIRFISIGISGSMNIRINIISSLPTSSGSDGV